MDINSQIANRILWPGVCERTYYTQELYNFWVDNWHDPYILFKIKIKGKYQKKYKWTDAETEHWIENNLEESKGYSVDGIWYAYDWGSGKNKILPIDKMHEPNLDHIIPKEQGGSDKPDNLRIRSRRVNENKGNTNSDQERFATIIDMIDDMNNLEYIDKIIEYANSIKNN